MSVTYVYAIVELLTSRPGQRPRPPRALRTAGHRVEIVPVGRLHAAVERLAAPPELSETALRSQHAVVVALARRFDAVLPARFGAVLEMSELARIVTRHQKAIRRAFEKVRGRQQMTVRVFGPERSPASTAAPPSGAAYLRGRQRAERIRLPATAARIRLAVQPLVEQERIDRGRGRLRATLHHLVHRGRAPAYRAAVRRALEPPARKDEVVVSGPWPPFAFTPELWP